MKKDKKRDLIRAILPSKARKQARFMSRRINRRTRHRTKEALNNHLSSADDWDDSQFFQKISRTEMQHKRDMVERIWDRRVADKLGPLYRFTEHHKKDSENDTEARQKIAETIEPGKNLITEHAMTHVDSWLDTPKSYLYLPPMTDRDKQAKEAREANYYGEVFWTYEDLKRIILTLFETNHKALNRALKDSQGRPLVLTRNICKKGEDPCMISEKRKIIVYEVFNPRRWKKWEEVSYHLYYKLRDKGDRVRYRTITKDRSWHNVRRCPYRLLVSDRNDCLRLAEVFAGSDGVVYDKEFESVHGWWHPYANRLDLRRQAMKNIRQLAEKYVG